MNTHIKVVAILLLSTTFLSSEAISQTKTLSDARGDHKTSLTRKTSEKGQLEKPPAELFSIVKYPTKIGEMSAYLSTPTAEGKKQPAMVWITGGFPAGGIGSSAWEPADMDNDQSAKAYREAGMVMMYPTFRGTNSNPGVQESLYGEVDDVIAAIEYLRTVDYVDTDRIYLGGHSTGGTLALLVACTGIKVKGIIAFGPVDDPSGYGSGSLTYRPTDKQENMLRSPIHYLESIQSPTFVIEGMSGNMSSLKTIQQANKNPKLNCILVSRASHFDVLGPANEHIASKIADASSTDELSLTREDLDSAFDGNKAQQREIGDLIQLARIRQSKIDLFKKQTAAYYFVAESSLCFGIAVPVAEDMGFTKRESRKELLENGRKIYVLVLTKEIVPSDLKQVFEASENATTIATQSGMEFVEWDVD